MRKVIQLDDTQLAAMEKGEVVTKMSGVLMGKVRSGIETGVKANLETARTRLASAP